MVQALGSARQDVAVVTPVAQVDRALALLTDSLDDTLLVVLADHGGGGVRAGAALIDAFHQPAAAAKALA